VSDLLQFLRMYIITDYIKGGIDTMTTDKDLLLLLQNNPERGLDKLINIYSGLIYTIVYSKLANSSTQDIEECVSDIIFELYKNRSNIDLKKGSIKAYISIIAKRKAIDNFRKRDSKVPKISIDDEKQSDLPANTNIEAEIINTEARNIIIQEINALGKPDSEIFIRKYYLGQSTKSIAKSLHLSENTVDKRRINSFHKMYYGYKGTDLNLVTNSGMKSYSIPSGFGGDSPKYVFEIDPTDTNFTLNIPYIIVQSTEDKNISLPIPEVDQIININKKIKFNDSTMTIVSVKRVNTEGGENGSLVLNINYDNKRSNLMMFSAQFNRINFWGTIQDGGYASTHDTNDIESTVYFVLKKDDKGTLRLKISNPQYYLTDAYNLKFDRK